MPDAQVLKIEEGGEKRVLEQVPQVPVVGDVQQGLGLAVAGLAAPGLALPRHQQGLVVLVTEALAARPVGLQVLVVEGDLVVLGALVRARHALVQVGLQDGRRYVRQRRCPVAVRLADVGATAQQQFHGLAVLGPARVVQRRIALVCEEDGQWDYRSYG